MVVELERDLAQARFPLVRQAVEQERREGWMATPMAGKVAK